MVSIGLCVFGAYGKVCYVSLGKSLLYCTDFVSILAEDGAYS